MNLLPMHRAAAQTFGARNNTPIDMLVIHVTESDTLSGTVAWFSTKPLDAAGNAQPHPVASAHYVVGQDGSVCQCVPEAITAFHAGNADVNRRSIGIEIVGHTETLRIPAEQMLALGELVTDIRRRHPNILLDRQHIIGHDEVPNPNDPTRFGGLNGHTDPGPHFDWTTFFAQLIPDVLV